MKNVVKLLVVFMIASTAGCKQEAVTNHFIADWVKSPVSPGGNTYLKITSTNNYETGYTVGPNYTQTSAGNYNFTANQITFYTSGAFTPCSNVPGTYGYKITRSQMVLTLISDGCVDSNGVQRSNTLAGTWGQ